MANEEQIWLGIAQKTGGISYFSFSSPISFRIVGIAPSSTTPVTVTSQGIAVYGTNDYKLIGNDINTLQEIIQ